jgi:uncharacterized Zn-finger protein
VLAEVAAAGYCVHPVQLHGTTVDVETGELSHTLLRVPCKDRRAAVCPACSYLYKADAWILIAAGMLGGKGLTPEVESHPRVFVTLTAPSFGAVHRVAKFGRCHPGSRAMTCGHGVTRICRTCHTDDDPLLGAPLCTDCFDYQEAVLWNATASRLWHRTMVRLRQGVGATQHLSEAELHKVARINYLKVAEFQRRGLVHFHAVIRADGPEGAESPPPEWLTTEVLEHQVRRLALTVVYKGTERRGFQWGTQLEISDVTAGEDDGRRIAGYLAKYAVKSTDGSATFARRFRRRIDIERMPARDHARQLALTAWDLGVNPELEALGLRRHAHAFGFTGQLITKSQGFSTTFLALREARAAYMTASNEGAPMVLGSYAYAGRGYTDPRGEAVAELLHTETVAMRQRAKERRVDELQELGSSRSGSQDGSRTGSHGSRSGSQESEVQAADPQ